MNKIIFFINCHVNRQYNSLLDLYLKDFQESGIQDRDDVKLIFVVVGEPEDSTSIMKKVKDHLPRLFGTYDEKDILTSAGTQRFELRMFDNSRYEHVGVETAWSEAMASDDDDLITYTHCRGLGHNNPRHLEMQGSREVFSMYASAHIIRNYDGVMKKFNTNPLMTKAGVTQSPGGWMWFNFWTARASYLKKKDKPDINGKVSEAAAKSFDGGQTVRHYYETWLGDDGESNESGCSLLINPDMGQSITGPQTIGAIRKISGRMF